MIKIGVVVKYFPKIQVALVNLISDLFLNEKVRFMKDRYTLFDHKIDEIKINYKKMDFAKAGSVVALKTNEEVEIGTEVYRIS